LRILGTQRPPQEWFKDWWASTDFQPLVYEHNSKISGADFFNRAELQQLREAYAAGLFAWILGERHKVRVKLDSDRFPDFQLERDGTVLPFELVEAYRTGERRGAEYKEAEKRKAAGLPDRLDAFDTVEDEKKAAPAITKAIEKKALKQYGSAPYLLVYVNFWLFDKPQMALEDFGVLAKPWCDKFPEIWLLWGANAIRCSPNPEMISATSVPKGMVP
jgi:hypothetical protein